MPEGTSSLDSETALQAGYTDGRQCIGTQAWGSR